MKIDAILKKLENGATVVVKDYKNGLNLKINKKNEYEIRQKIGEDYSKKETIEELDLIIKLNDIVEMKTTEILFSERYVDKVTKKPLTKETLFNNRAPYLRVSYYLGNKIHREDGAAVIHYENEKILKYFYLDDKRVTQGDLIKNNG